MKYSEKYLSMFWYWIRERESIRLKKEAGGPMPWSDDPVFNTYHFCNVCREDDRGTKEIRAVVQRYLPGEDAITMSSLPTIYTMARMFNYAPTVEFVLGATNNGHSIKEAFDLLKVARDNDVLTKIFHVAYVVSTAGQAVDKVDYVRGVVGCVQRLAVPTNSLQAAHAALMTVPGLGGTGFLAGQVVADLRNDRYLVEAAAGQDYASMGPGSKKGLDIIIEETTKTNISNFTGRLEWLYEVMPEDVWAMEIHAQDLQNCLCEFSKYVRHDGRFVGRIRYYRG